MTKPTHNPGFFKHWMQGRMAKRLQKQFDLSEAQAAELMPILKRLRQLRRRPDSTQLADLNHLLRAETADQQALTDWASNVLESRQQSMRDHTEELSAFVSTLGMTQRQKLAEFVTKPPRCGCRRRHCGA